MASFTENLGLKKPDRLDRFSIEDFNGNMDIIDGRSIRKHRYNRHSGGGRR